VFPSQNNVLISPQSHGTLNMIQSQVVKTARYHDISYYYYCSQIHWTYYYYCILLVKANHRQTDTALQISP